MKKILITIAIVLMLVITVMAVVPTGASADSHAFVKVTVNGQPPVTVSNPYFAHYGPATAFAWASGNNQACATVTTYTSEGGTIGSATAVAIAY